MNDDVSTIFYFRSSVYQKIFVDLGVVLPISLTNIPKNHANGINNIGLP